MPKNLMRNHRAQTLGLFLVLSTALTTQAALIFPKGSSWKYFKGTQEASLPDTTAWRGLNFDDSVAGWLTGNAAFYYEASSGYTGSTDLGSSGPDGMNGNYSCIYLRKKFSVTNPANVGTLTVDVSSDDGAVVWINGIAVANLGGPTDLNTITRNSVAIDSNGEPKEGSFTVDATGLVQTGDNVIAVQAFNGSLSGSSDFLIDVALSSSEPDLVAPTIALVDPAPGTVSSLTSITVTFSEPVVGVDSADLLFNNVFLAASVTGGPQVYTFNFEQPPFGVLEMTWAAGHEIADFGLPPNAFDGTGPGATWEYNLEDIEPPVVTLLSPPESSIVRQLSQIDIQFSELVTGVDPADLEINGQPATGLSSLPGGFYTFFFTAPATGLVQVAWATGHGITDLAAQPNPFAGGSWTYTYDPNAPAPNLVLNEILASNQTGLQDEDGEFSDWIEIWNRGGSSINLEGWSLSDDPDVPGKWIFPSYVLGANQYLVVFASVKDIKAPVGSNKFHTNFKLGLLGEHIGLYSPDSPRVPASGLFGKFPEQRNDHSYGIDANGEPRYFATPTPGGPNGESSITGVVEPVHFSVHRGYFSEPFTLNLSCPTKGAVIRFTLDGSEPTETKGERFLSPLMVSDTTLVRAAAFRENYLPSLVGTHSYFFNLTPALRSLPLLSIVTDTNNIYGPTGIIGIKGGSGPPSNEWQPIGPDDYHNPKASQNDGRGWERPTSVEFIQADNSGFQIDAGIRVHGSTWTRPRYSIGDKFSFKLFFRGEYGPTKLESDWIPGSTVRAYDQIVLRAGHNDIANPYIRDSLVRQLSSDMGQSAVLGNFANLFINGTARTTGSGLFYYNPSERVEAGWLQSVHGGGEQWDVITVGAAAQDGDNLNFVALRNFITGQDVTNPSIYQTVGQRLDLVNFVDYLLVNVYGATWDWPHNNWRAARERSPNGIWRFYIWDAEGAFGGGGGHTINTDSFTQTSQGLGDPSADIARFYRTLKTNPEFRLLFADRIQKHFFNNGALADANITQRHNEMRDQMLGVIAGFNNTIITAWVPGRRNVLFNQFNNQGLLSPVTAPTFSQHGGLVASGFTLTMTGPASATIYYTTNNTDPRVIFSGAVGEDAVAYDAANPPRLNESMVVKARAVSNGVWSAVTEANFQVASLGIPLRITEIMYNPSGNNSAHEYVELQNTGTLPLVVSGFYFEGIDFTFPDPSVIGPGQIFLLASDIDPAAFAARYPGATVNGFFDGNLSNGGERLTLKDRNGNIVVSVDYRDGGGWPAAADGQGYSLEIIDSLGAPDEPANWRASLDLNGSAGQPNAAAPASTVVLHEILAENLGAVPNGPTYPDYVELHNTGSSSVNISGWSLSDDGNPRKFVFPANTTIAAQGYLVVWCDDATNTTPGLHAGFALSRSEESIFLYDGQTNRVDAVSLGAQIADFSVGRINGAWTLNTPTTNAANLAVTLASASSLTLNEWLANPLPGDDDWIELYNKSASLPVSLQGLYLQAGGSIQVLPALAFLPPQGHIQIHADENPGADHVDFRLPASGSTITLYDPVAIQIESVTYTAQSEGVSGGRLPDGNTTLVNFPGTASPGAPNYVAAYNGPILSEVMARNVSSFVSADGVFADWVELYNGGGAAADLSGMSLSVDRAEAGQWLIPAGTMIPAGGYLIIGCDDTHPASVAPGPELNTGRSLNGASGGVYLFNALGQLVNFVEYGFQVEDQSLGLTAGQWKLLAAPSPGAANGTAAPLGAATNLRINEWMANPDGGNDWFELYNMDALPVDLSGLYLTDDPTTAGVTNDPIAALSFIAGQGYIRWEADGNPGKGRNHVGFSLDGAGESLRLYNRDKTVIDSVYFAAQPEGVSEGRLPDGAASLAMFETTASPERSNYLPSEVVINEALTHTDPPLEDAIELYNTSSAPVDLSGWYLSDSRRNFKKYRIPDGTVIAGHGYQVFYENQFNDGSANAFALNSAHGGSIWLSEAGPGNSLTGVRATVDFGAALNGISFGRVVTSVGKQFVAASLRSFGMDNPASEAEFRTGTGLPNPGPQVGPIVINEIMYHPPDLTVDSQLVDNNRDEFVELHNLSPSAVALFDPNHPANVWTVRGGVDFDFPPDTSIPAGGFLLLVSFDPVNDTASLTAFKAAYGITGNPTILGPYSGQLDNSGETVRLYRPDNPQTAPSPDVGFVPQILQDEVRYRDRAPWPAGDVDGGGLSLQKPSPGLFGNEPLNLVADMPTPGAANGSGILPRPVIIQSPTDRSAFPGTRTVFNVAATGSGPFTYQWRFNGENIAGATDQFYVIDYVTVPDDGEYDVIVSNAGASALSARARLNVTAPPLITVPPLTQTVNEGDTVTFIGAAIGPAPLSYQWLRNGKALPDATGATLVVENAQLEDGGVYAFQVTNPNATVSAEAILTVLVRPSVIIPPIGQAVVEGTDVTLSILARGTLPMGYRWRRGSTTVINEYIYASQSFLTLKNVALTENGQRYTVVLTNAAFVSPGVLSSAATLTVLADSDHDGVPDNYESAHGMNPNDPADAQTDHDNDGVNTAQEYQAGTDPFDEESYLKVESLNLTGEAAVLRFVAASNKTYTVEYRDNLTGSPWQPLTNVAAQSATAELQLVDESAVKQLQRIYRLVTPKQ